MTMIRVSLGYCLALAASLASAADLQQLSVSPPDINLATASNAIVIGFNVTADERARSAAEERKVEMRFYQVIYKVLDDVKAALEQRLAPQREEEIHGHAEIRQVFKASKIGNIAGCMVTDGFINRNDQIRLIRDGKIMLTHYSAGLLFSPEARAKFVEPDLDAIPRHDRPSD